jgi:hypothetical protein
MFLNGRMNDGSPRFLQFNTGTCVYWSALAYSLDGAKVIEPRVTKMSQALRIRLDEITDDLDKYPLETHPQCLSDLARVKPHAILPLNSVAPLGTYNCVLHALDLVGRMTEYQDPLLVARTAFVSYLIKEGALKGCNAQSGALVTWSTSQGLKHIGKLVSPIRAESKWGLGILCEHGLEEIPIRYGDPSGFYSPLNSQTTLDCLDQFLHKELPRRP